MQLEPLPRPEHVLRASAKLITSSTILHLTAEELEHAIDQEQMENPTFDVDEQLICLFCGARMYVHGQTCTNCGSYAQPVRGMREIPSTFDSATEVAWSNAERLFDVDNYGFAGVDLDEEFDPLVSIAKGETLAEILLRQLEMLVSPGEEPIAEQLVGNLNERGYLEISVDEIAEHLHVPVERVEYVLSQLQTLEPVGIGARSVRECLLIQLQALSEQETLHPLAYILIDRFLNKLGRSQFHEIARELGVREQEVRMGSHYIRTKLYPFPAHAYKGETQYCSAGNDATYMRPDVIIRVGADGFEVELIEEKRYRLRISSEVVGQMQSSGVTQKDIQRYLHQYNDRGKFFIDCVQRRWRTLKRVTELVIDYQRDFLEHGVRFLRPLTRAEIASRLNLDEGTVSRATANKFVLLPNGRLIPFADFFDGSLGVKDMLRELISSEEPKRRLSDEELAQLIQAQGIPMARRTVTKYREEMGIGSSRER
ncbi:MAG TPA: RNA polymerase factor sigma-54 [Ktedonobacteraceae bacterium]